MKKMIMVILSVVLLLPLIASCGSSVPQGDPVAVKNVKVVSYANAYEEATETGKPPVRSGEAEILYEGPVNAYVVEGEQMTLGDLMAGYAYEIDATAYKDGNDIYVKINDLSANDEFYWDMYVDGNPAGLSQPITPDSVIEIRYQRLDDVSK